MKNKNVKVIQCPYCDWTGKENELKEKSTFTKSFEKCLKVCPKCEKATKKHQIEGSIFIRGFKTFLTVLLVWPFTGLCIFVGTLYVVTAFWPKGTLFGGLWILFLVLFFIFTRKVELL